jgi:hypothetical protein
MAIKFLLFRLMLGFGIEKFWFMDEETSKGKAREEERGMEEREREEGRKEKGRSEEGKEEGGRKEVGRK